MKTLRKVVCFPLDLIFACLFWTLFALSLLAMAFVTVVFMFISIPFIVWVWSGFSDKRCEKLLFEAEKDTIQSYHLDETCIRNSPIERHGGINMRYLAFEHDDQVKTIIILHGEGMSSIHMAPLAQILSKKYNVYVLDLPGFGRSNISSKSFFSGDPVRGIIHYIDEFVKAQGIDRFALVGHSFGAFVAVSYADFYKERVSHMVLVDPLGIFPGVGTLGAFWAVFYKFRLNYLPHYLGRWGRICAYYMLDDIHMWYLLSHPNSPGKDIIASMIHVGPLGGYWKDTKSHILSMTTINTSLVYGRYDMIVGVHQGRAMHDLFKMDLFIVEGRGHVPFDTPDGVVEVAQFIHDSVSVSDERSFTVASTELKPEVWKTGFNPMSVKYAANDMYSETLVA